MNKYVSYKDSIHEGIDELPSHWGQYLIKRGMELLTDYEANGSFESVKENVQFVEVEDNNRYAWYVRATDLENNHLSDYNKLRFVDESSYHFLRKTQLIGGELLVSKRGEIGKVYLMPKFNDFKATLAPNLYLVRLDTNKLFPKYSHYLFMSVYGQSILKNANKSTTIGALYKDDFKALPFLFPPIEEQTTIANFLDQKTSQIDELIAKKERLIKLLEEERTAMINQAVTKGLEPNVPMKDSGIEWLGEIPEHWISYRIDWVIDIIRGNSAFKKDELLNTGEYIALQYGKTYKVDVVDDSFNFFVNSEFYKESQIVSTGDTIIISTSETIEDLGHTCFYNNENIGLIGGEQILLKPNREVLNEKYLYQYARQLRLELKKYAKGLKVFRFNTNDVKSLFIVIPSIEEQIQIVDFLDRETIRIQSLVEKMEKEIELLKEYKTALISEVVTGKVDVRSFKQN